MQEQNTSNRRPISSRSNIYIQKFASFLAKTKISPNQISIASVFFSIIGSVFLLANTSFVGLIVCAICIQLRLFCNLIDGMVAIEGGKKSTIGLLFNEFPDRIADSVLLISLGYAIHFGALGWFSALVAALTAYIRVFRGSLGQEQDFRGPMAKQHRMAVMTIGCVLGIVEVYFTGSSLISLLVASLIIAVGSVITCITRTKAIVDSLKPFRLSI
jgi:Phosphatidylglycerophosphate synthase